MPASSKAQKRFFDLVRAVQKGDVPSSKVTSNVRQAAKDTSRSDVEDMTDTKTKNLPDKIVPDDDNREKEKEDESFNFADIVGRYNEYGRILSSDHTLGELAQQLSDIAEYAEHTLTNEMDDWFDAHTVRRNVKEMKGYAKEFSKIAMEADSYNQRMKALYDDMGRVLERYFDIYDSSHNEGCLDCDETDDMDVDVDTSMGEFTHEPNPDAKKMIDDEGVSLTDQIADKAISMIRERLRGEQLVRFDSFDPAIQRKVAWRALERR